MRESKVLYKALKLIYKPIMRFLYRPTIIGKENIPKDGSLIIAGNHKHAFDPVLVTISTKRMVRFMAKDKVCQGFHGIIFDKIGTIRIYEGKLNPIAINEAEKVLKSGGALGIFPEGTRNRTEEELLKFRKGTVLIAKKVNAPIVPFAIKGNYKMFKKGLTIEFGVPININEMEIEEANNYLKSEVLKLLRK